MLKDTDDHLLCPACGGNLWIGVRQFFYGPAYYDAKSNDYIDHEIATEREAMGTTYTGLWCQECRWMTRQVDEYLEEIEDD